MFSLFAPLEMEFIKQNAVLLYGFLALFALIIGSLLNLIIYRLPLMLKREMLLDCQEFLRTKSGTQDDLSREGTSDDIPELPEKPFNLFFPRSFCPSCKHTIKAIHNVPLLSYLLLLGRCAYCKHPIPMRYPLVEVVSALLSLLAAVHFGFGLTLLFALVFIWIQIVLISIDLEHQLLPDALTLSLLWLGLFANTQSLFVSLPDAVFSAAAAYLLLWCFIKCYYLATGKIGMGHGDFKLFAALSAWFGIRSLPFILILASLTGAIIGIIYINLKKKSKDTPIPFGPFLSLAGLIYLFFDKQIISLY
jgi:leader peptidase (prepilin peptidase)/N-methyltransferase